MSKILLNSELNVTIGSTAKTNEILDDNISVVFYEYNEDGTINENNSVTTGTCKFEFIDSDWKPALSLANNKIKITCDKNDTDNDRSCKVKLTNNIHSYGLILTITLNKLVNNNGIPILYIELNTTIYLNNIDVYIIGVTGTNNNWTLRYGIETIFNSIPGNIIIVPNHINNLTTNHKITKPFNALNYFKFNNLTYVEQIDPNNWSASEQSNYIRILAKIKKDDGTLLYASGGINNQDNHGYVELILRD